MSFSEDTIRKRGHRACLRGIPLMPLPAVFHARHFTVHFSVAGSKGFQRKH